MQSGVELLVLTACMCVGVNAAGESIDLVQTEVFVAGQDGYHTYRIPAIVCTKQGTLLAFCEGRKHGSADSGQIDLVLKRSKDRGASWSPMQVVASQEGYTIGNPAPIVDRNTGTIWLALTKNRAEDTEDKIMKGEAPPRTAWMTKSLDDGITWAPPVEISVSVRGPDWRWYATGPGHGIQLSNGTLMVACDHSLGNSVKDMHSHVFYSGDGGASWKLGGSTDGYMDESSVAELGDGRLYLNMRSYRGAGCRAVTFSADGGKSWLPVRDDKALIEPVCEASCLRYTSVADGGKNRMLFSNPASAKREKMTVRLSYDECATWPVARELHAGPAAYSDLVVLPDRTIGCLYERGEQAPYERVTFARFTLAWLTRGQETSNR